MYLPFVFAVLLMAVIRVNTMSRLERVRHRWAQLKATQINYEEYKWELWLIHPVRRGIPVPVAMRVRRCCCIMLFFRGDMRHLPASLLLFLSMHGSVLY
jgi:hypothetical protein